MRCLSRWTVHRLTHRHLLLGVGDQQALLCDPRRLGRVLRRRTRYYVADAGLGWTQLTRAQFVSYTVRQDLGEEPS